MVQTFDPTRATLTAAVGPGQPNNRDDVLTVQRLLNAVFGRRRIPTGVCLVENGIYSQQTEFAIRSFERLYFYGISDPFHRIEPDEDMFCHLQYAAAMTTAVLDPVLSNELYMLAAIMVPGGRDRLLNARPKRTHMLTGDLAGSPPVVSAGAIRHYLPQILKALDQKDLADVDMLLMALATIQAETMPFTPIDEGISKYNTSPKGTKGRHPFDLYDNRKKDLGNLGAPDGERFKGRGFIQLTGRRNYERISKDLGLGDELVRNPEKANDPVIAALALGQYLKNNEREIRSAIAHGNLAYARRLVNGGSHHLNEFMASFNAGRQFLKMSVIVRTKTAAAKSAKSKKAI